MQNILGLACSNLQIVLTLNYFGIFSKLLFQTILEEFSDTNFEKVSKFQNKNN